MFGADDDDGDDDDDDDDDDESPMSAVEAAELPKAAAVPDCRGRFVGGKTGGS